MIVLLFRLVLWLTLSAVAVFVGAFIGAVLITKCKWWNNGD